MRILFQGDSITDGNRYRDPAQRWDKNHQIGHSYAFIIAGRLGFAYPTRYEFINRAISGNTVQALEERWERDTIAEKPNLLSVLVGINGNGKVEGRYPADFDRHLKAFDESYRRILGSAKAHNPALKLVLIEPFALPVGIYADTYPVFKPCFDRIRESVARIADELGAVLVPMQDELDALSRETPPVYWLWDGIHPTESTHWLLAERWLKYAGKLLEQ